MYHAMSQPGHSKPLVIDSLTGNTWYGVVPEEVINLDNKPRPSLIYLKMDQDRQGFVEFVEHVHPMRSVYTEIAKTGRGCIPNSTWKGANISMTSVKTCRVYLT